MFKNEKFTKALQKQSIDSNLLGKRLRDKKLETAENFRPFLLGLFGIGVPEAGDLVDWLEQNKPEKPEKIAKVRKANKPSAKTMAGNENRTRDTLQVIEGDVFIITSAQNNTSVSSVFKQLKQAAIDLNAQLLVMPSYYNKKAFSASVEGGEDEFFADDVKPYLIELDSWLHGENVVKIAAQSAIPLTAKMPINSAQTLNNGELCTIIPHPKCQQRTLLKMAGEAIKTAWTSASCTQFNYIRGRAGSEAENVHSFGGVLVEIINGKPFTTNIIQSQDGSLMFFDHRLTLFSYNTVNEDYPIVVVGDSHFEVFDPIVFADVKNVLERTGAKMAVCHDIAHSESRNHHNIAKGSHWYKAKNTSIFNELKFVIDRVNEYAELVDDLYLCQSNHNAVIDGWLDSQNTANTIMYDTVNSKLYHLMKYLVCEAIDHGDPHAGLMLAFENADLTGLPVLAENVRWGAGHIPEVHYNVEYNTHGHKGANGAAKGLTTGKISQSMCLGHTHSPEIAYMTGRGGITTQGTTAKMDQGYNRGGGSSWAQASSITHSNGITQQYFHAL